MRQFINPLAAAIKNPLISRGSHHLPKREQLLLTEVGVEYAVFHQVVHHEFCDKHVIYRLNATFANRQRQAGVQIKFPGFFRKRGIVVASFCFFKSCGDYQLVSPKVLRFVIAAIEVVNTEADIKLGTTVS